MIFSIKIVDAPLNVKDLTSLVSFFEYFMFSGDKKSTIHSLVGSNNLKNVISIKIVNLPYRC